MLSTVSRLLSLTVPVMLALHLSSPAHAEAAPGPVELLSWGGDFAAAQEAAYSRPFTEATGIAVRMNDSDDPAMAVKAQVEAGNVTADLASVGNGDAARLCDERLVEPVDLAALSAAPDGTPATDDFVEGGLGPCFVASDIYATVIAYDRGRTNPPPRSAADFFDLVGFPGRRGLGRTPEFTMELALLADGVPTENVYPLLATPEGQDRAFAKLDSIRDQIVWWEAGAQPAQLLAAGEVAMTHAYNGRIFKAAVEDGQDVAILWDGQIYEIEGWVIPTGAPHAEAARAFLQYATSPEALARAAALLPYGPPRASSQALVGGYKGTDLALTPHLPTTPANMVRALPVDPNFWAEHEIELRDRFAAWLAR